VAVLCAFTQRYLGYVMIALYSPSSASVSLNCSIYYNFLCELPRIHLKRTSENPQKAKFAEFHFHALE
jgi:hypothetical protein